MVLELELPVTELCHGIPSQMVLLQAEQCSPIPLQHRKKHGSLDWIPQAPDIPRAYIEYSSLHGEVP